MSYSDADSIPFSLRVAATKPTLLRHFRVRCGVCPDCRVWVLDRRPANVIQWLLESANRQVQRIISASPYLLICHPKGRFVIRHSPFAIRRFVIAFAMRYLLFFKPYDVLSDFADPDGPADPGRLCPDARGRTGRQAGCGQRGADAAHRRRRLAHRLTDPSFKLPKTYFVQVERTPDAPALQKLRRGVLVKGEMTAPAEVELLPPQPELPPRPVPVTRAPRHPHRLAEDRPARGQEAADPPHDRRGGPSHPAPRARRHRPADAARARARRMAGADAGRAGRAPAHVEIMTARRQHRTGV